MFGKHSYAMQIELAHGIKQTTYSKTNRRVRFEVKYGRQSYRRLIGRSSRLTEGQLADALNTLREHAERQLSRIFAALTAGFQPSPQGSTRDDLVLCIGHFTEHLAFSEEIQRSLRDRHVDDYYFGLKSEADGLVVLSKVREVLAGFELQLNDLKTRIYPSVEPINDLWAQSVRKTVGVLNSDFGIIQLTDLEYAIDETLSVARQVRSDSPVKILLRRLDEVEIYSSEHWGFAEHYFQRILHRHPHAIDYVCLLVVKRFALGLDMDKEGWGNVATMLLRQHMAYDNHHEVLWLAWLVVVCRLDVSHELFVELAKNPNSHVKAFLIQAYVDGLIENKPKISLGGKLSSENSDWVSFLRSLASGGKNSGH